MAKTIEIMVKQSRRSISGERDVFYGPEPELSALIENLEAEAKDLGLPVEQDYTRIDKAKGRRFHVPTVDVELYVTLSIVIPAATFSLVKGAEFLKTLLEIVDKSLDIEKKIRDRRQAGDEHKSAKVSVRIDDKLATIQSQEHLDDILREISEKGDG